MVVVVVYRAVGPTEGVAVVVAVAIITRSLVAVTSTVGLVIWTFARVRYHVPSCHVVYHARHREQHRAQDGCGSSFWILAVYGTMDGAAMHGSEGR